MRRHLYFRFAIAAALCAIVANPPAPGQSDSGIQVYQNVLKSTVWIHSERGSSLATGSGSLIDRRRCMILTNYHVVGGIDRATVYFPAYRGGQVIAERDYYRQRVRGIRGTVKARDQQADLAIIQLDSVPDGAQALVLAPGSPAPGQSVHSIGNPGGSGALWVYTPGRVRQVYHKRWQAELDGRLATFDAKVVETDSATNPGDSGGPLVNDKVELVGVTQGGAAKAQLLSVFVDVTEVQRFLNTQHVRAIRPVAGVRDTERAGSSVNEERPVFPIKDGGEFFSAEAEKKANEEIKRVVHRFGRDLLIETYATVPPQDSEKVRAMSSDERKKYFHDWTQKLAREKRANGVTILICRNPTYLWVNVAKDAEPVFDRAAADRLQEMLMSRFRERRFDEGLLAGVKMVADKLAEQKP
jgi:Trypsin-like peptidase domain/TPM domain